MSRRKQVIFIENGPGKSDLALLILEPHKNNEEGYSVPRTFPFTFQETISGGFKQNKTHKVELCILSINGLSSGEMAPRDIKLFDPLRGEFYKAHYNLHARRGQTYFE